MITVAIVAACSGDEPSDSPAVEPVVDCLAVPAEKCQNALNEAVANAGDGARVAAVRIRCTAPSCTTREGQIAVTVLLADGRQITTGSGWAVAAPAVPVEVVEVPLPVRPICIRVRRDTCEDLAKSAVQGPTGRAVAGVVSITVQCAAGTLCDGTRGTGSTDVTLLDGTHQTGGWSYEGETGP